MNREISNIYLEFMLELRDELLADGYLGLESGDLVVKVLVPLQQLLSNLGRQLKVFLLLLGITRMTTRDGNPNPYPKIRIQPYFWTQKESESVSKLRIRIVNCYRFIAFFIRFIFTETFLIILG